MAEYVDPYVKRADCEEDYISPTFNIPAEVASGSSTTTSGTSDVSVI